MEQIIADFPMQLREAVEIGKDAPVSKHVAPLRQILVTGLGGSGVGGNVVSDILSDRLRLPFAVNKDYNMPGYVNKNTLVIASSYSGNTEETLLAMEEALSRHAKVVCITSGGKMAKNAIQHDLDLILLPEGRPPRGCLGYSFVQQLFILYYLKLINKDFINDIERGAQLLEKECEGIQKEAQKIAKVMQGKMPIIYAPQGYESAAIRWRQQINENSKMLCWHSMIPEMNHNELVGWRTKDPQWVPIFLNAPDVHERNQLRIDINKQVIAQYADRFFEIKAKGRTRLQRLLHMMWLGDWVSVYMAQHRQVDAMEVKVIDFLKAELAKR